MAQGNARTWPGVVICGALGDSILVTEGPGHHSFEIAVRQVTQPYSEPARFEAQDLEAIRFALNTLAASLAARKEKAHEH